MGPSQTQMCPNWRAHRVCVECGVDPGTGRVRLIQNVDAHDLQYPDFLSYEIHARLTVAHVDTPGRTVNVTPAARIRRPARQSAAAVPAG